MNLIDKNQARMIALVALVTMCISITVLIFVSHWAAWAALVVCTAVLMFVNSIL